MRTKIIFLMMLSTSLINYAQNINDKPELVASFQGQQVTGVTVANNGDVFANFPRWRQNVLNSVVQINKNGTWKPYPDRIWNSWEIGMPQPKGKFVAVQSVVAKGDYLYVLDTRNPEFKGVLSNPRIFVFNIVSNVLEYTYVLPEGIFKPNSYLNDLRVDDKNKHIYLTDSGEAGLVVLDRENETFTRTLDNHYSTKAEQDALTIYGKKWMNTVHSDGIALSPDYSELYYHSLTGYTLYKVKVDKLIIKSEKVIASSVEKVAVTSAPDGMIFDKEGNLYYGDLEHNKIMKRQLDGQTKVLLEGDLVQWPDTFSVYNGYLYYTNSRISEANGDVSGLTFTIYKIKL